MMRNFFVFSLLLGVVSLWTPAQSQGQGQGQGQGQSGAHSQFKNALLAAVASDDSLSTADVDEYVEFAGGHGRFGQNFNPGDFRKRYGAFQRTKAENVGLNANANSHTSHGRAFREEYGITKFADWTVEEKQAMLMPVVARGQEPRRRLVTPDCTSIYLSRWDATDNTGTVTTAKDNSGAIKDQGATNGCWAFAATAAFEANYKKEKGITKVFSEQEGIDCSTQWFGGTKANGGWSEELTAVYDTSGACPTASYATAYDTSTDLNGQCDSCQVTKTIASCREWDAMGQSKERLTKAAASGFAFAFFMLIDSSFHSLTGDYYSSSCWAYTGAHAMAVVGQFEGEKILVRNSWGTDWGDNGYFWIDADSLLPDACQYPGYFPWSFNKFYGSAPAAQEVYVPQLGGGADVAPEHGEEFKLDAVPTHHKESPVSATVYTIALSAHDSGNMLAFVLGSVFTCVVCVVGGAVFMMVLSLCRASRSRSGGFFKQPKRYESVSLTQTSSDSCPESDHVI